MTVCVDGSDSTTAGISSPSAVPVEVALEGLLAVGRSSTVGALVLGEAIEPPGGDVRVVDVILVVLESVAIIM